MSTSCRSADIRTTRRNRRRERWNSEAAAKAIELIEARGTEQPTAVAPSVTPPTPTAAAGPLRRKNLLALGAVYLVLSAVLVVTWVASSTLFVLILALLLAAGARPRHQ